MDWRLLRADEIELRTGQKTKDGTRQSLLLYKDARCDMARLDELGRYNWQREHKDVHGVSYCGVSLWDKDKACWVTKWDAGEKSNASPEKGEASDAFKRACVNWGIGRELYTAPQIWVEANLDPRKLRVTQIDYNDKREITTLIITDEKGTTIFSKGKVAPAAPAAPVQQKGGAIYPANDTASKAAQDAYTGILADIQSVETYNDLIALMRSERVQTSPYKEALLRSGHGYAKRKGWE